MSETFYYADLTQIMAVPYDGMTVPAAHGAQVRENLMAIYTGETFKVSSSVAQTSGLVYTYNTIDWATPNVQTAAGFGPGYLLGSVVIPAGVWIIGFCADQVTPGPVSLRVSDAQGRVPVSQSFARDNAACLIGCYAAGGFGATISVLPDVTPNTSVAEMRTELWGYQIIDI